MDYPTLIRRGGAAVAVGAVASTSIVQVAAAVGQPSDYCSAQYYCVSGDQGVTGDYQQPGWRLAVGTGNFGTIEVPLGQAYKTNGTPLAPSAVYTARNRDTINGARMCFYSGGAGGAGPDGLTRDVPYFGAGWVDFNNSQRTSTAVMWRNGAYPAAQNPCPLSL